jgi:hypothetical protein
MHEDVLGDLPIREAGLPPHPVPNVLIRRGEDRIQLVCIRTVALDPSAREPVLLRGTTVAEDVRVPGRLVAP